MVARPFIMDCIELVSAWGPSSVQNSTLYHIVAIVYLTKTWCLFQCQYFMESTVCNAFDALFQVCFLVTLDVYIHVEETIVLTVLVMSEASGGQWLVQNLLQEYKNDVFLGYFQ